MNYILPSDEKFEKLFMKKVKLHSITNDKPQNKTEEIVNKVLEDAAIKFLVPEDLFWNYYNENKDIKKCSEYFRVEEKIIEKILEHNKNNLKTLKKSR